ncbi:MAG: TIM barrel protein [Novosphingobium sp.]|nr:TIM barrel protein [Novosphingobium sp.]
MRKLGIEMLTTLGMPPLEYVRLAGEVGCGEISTGLGGLPLSMFGVDDVFYPEWSLADDPTLRREMIATMRDLGVAIGLGEGFRAHADEDVSGQIPSLDLMAELGALRINAIGLDPDKARCFDQLGKLSELVNERGMMFTVEFCPGFAVGTFGDVMELIGQIGAGRCHVLLDTMHFCQTGGSVEQLKAVEPGTIGYLQLADSPAQVPEADYMNVAMFERRVPGEGDLPLRELIAALPADITISIEVPNLAALRDIGPHDHVAKCVAAARELGA